MNAHKKEQTRIAAKAISQGQFKDIPQMMRWRRLVEKYNHTALILNGSEVDFINACEAFMAIDILDMSGICKLAVYETMFTTFENQL